MHRFQAIGFAGRRPPQLVVGNGGMELSDVFPKPSAEDPKRPVLVPDLAGVRASVVGLRDFGTMILTPGDAGAWTSVLVDPTGKKLATCDSRWPHLRDGRSVCALE